VATRLGAGDLADRQVPLETCVRTLVRALDAGLNVVDTAPAYEDGYSEEIVGRALRGRRDSVFLIDKIDHLHEPVGLQVAASLSRLGVEQADLFVFHDCSTLGDWAAVEAPGGGLDQLRAEIAAGRARFAGFKTFGAGKLLGDTEGYSRPLQGRPRGKVSSGGLEDTRPALPRLSVEECVRYTLTLDPDVALLGLSFPNEQDAAFAAATAFEPLFEAQLADVRRRAEESIRGKGRCWWNPEPSPR
jgi:hypothetical protein